MVGTEIHPDGNALVQLGNHVFTGKKKLNNSNIKPIHQIWARPTGFEFPYSIVSRVLILLNIITVSLKFTSSFVLSELLCKTLRN